jgi:hypothetical protein
MRPPLQPADESALGILPGVFPPVVNKPSPLVVVCNYDGQIFILSSVTPLPFHLLLFLFLQKGLLLLACASVDFVNRTEHILVRHEDWTSAGPDSVTLRVS